nr:hypothetical protein [Tanacetum cinerariifolium]
MQTQTSNTLHNAIMEAGSKDRPSMLAPGNYVQWKSRIKRYIDTKPNHELIHHCLKNPPYKFTWADKEVSISKGSPVTRTELQMETYKTVSQDIRDQLNAEAESVQIILTGIDNDIYSTVDAYPNACEMWKAIKRLKQELVKSVSLKLRIVFKFCLMLLDLSLNFNNEYVALTAAQLEYGGNTIELSYMFNLTRVYGHGKTEHALTTKSMRQ